jgi:hypothetical protein
MAKHLTRASKTTNSAAPPARRLPGVGGVLTRLGWVWDSSNRAFTF